MAIRKSNKLPQVIILKQILKRCSSLVKKQGYDDGDHLPIDVPKVILQFMLERTEPDKSYPFLSRLTLTFCASSTALRKNLALVTTWESPFPAKKLFFGH